MLWISLGILCLLFVALLVLAKISIDFERIASRLEEQNILARESNKMLHEIMATHSNMRKDFSLAFWKQIDDGEERQKKLLDEMMKEF